MGISNRMFVLAMIVWVFATGSFFAQSCNYNIMGNNNSEYTYSNCSTITVNFGSGAMNNSFSCNNSRTIKLTSAIFGNGTYNNTIYNCTYSNAKIYVMHNSSNNLIGNEGNRSLIFADNESSIAEGYYFKFVSLNRQGKTGIEGFAALFPYALEVYSNRAANDQDITLNFLRQIANNNNYMMPRFGYYIPGPVGAGNVSFAVEKELIYKNKNVNFNPYWFIVPYWGHDILSFKEFNITGNMNYTPTFVVPDMAEWYQMPDNANVYWNYTVIKYSNAPNMTAYLWKGWQASPNGSIIYTVGNITNETIRFDRGRQTLGIHETIAVLKSPSVGEQDNSTTETYSVGLSACTVIPLNMSGYYSMNVHELYLPGIFQPTNKTCDYAVTVDISNVTINCKGGVINSTKQSIQVFDSKNVNFENCNIEGNAFNLYNSSVEVINSSVKADYHNNTLVSGMLSNITFVYTKINGYNYTPESNQTLKILYDNKLVRSTTKAVSTAGVSFKPAYYALGAFICMVIISAIVYLAMVKTLKL
jgi:hypothetical protein